MSKNIRDDEKKILDRKSTNTAFYLMFPALILAGIAIYYSSLGGAVLSTALAIYQFLMLKKFIEDYYRK